MSKPVKSKEPVDRDTAKNAVYTRYAMDPAMSTSQLIMELDALQEKLVKEDGVIYTPQHIVAFMIKQANPTPQMRIIEPSCGHGIFLIGLLDHMSSTHSMNPNALHQWFVNQVVGVELNAPTVMEVKKILAAYFAKYHQFTVDPNTFVNIHTHDGLTYQDTQAFDLCIGNPPYIRAKHLDSIYLAFLKKTYSTCRKGTIDIYFAFMEHYINACQSVMFIVPNSFLTSKAGSNLKTLVATDLRLLIDFKEKRVFKDASVYTCIFHTQKTSANATHTHATQIHNTPASGSQSNHAQGIVDPLLYGHDIDQLTVCSKAQCLTQAPNSLGMNQKVYSGIATLADALFKVKRKGPHYMAHFNGVDYPIEAGILAPYLKLTKMQSQADLAHIDYMIYPYDAKKNVLPEAYLAQTFPLAYAYLLQIKAKLNLRDKGKTQNYPAWYAYGRKQGLHTYTHQQFIAIPQMLCQGSCVPYTLDLSALLSQFNAVVFTSGFLVEDHAHQPALKDFLTPRFLDFAKNKGKPWPGATHSYYSLTSHQVRSFV